MTRLPDFIIIGAMKCATSTLHEQLARLPGVFMSDPKEPCFFSDDSQWSRGLEWYASLFAAAPRDAICGESSTHYTKLPTYPNTIQRMRRTLPSHVKFIYIFRHPIDRLVSHYIHDWTEAFVSDPIDLAIDTHPGLIDYGRYAMQLEPYFEAFGQERVLPVFFDRLSSQPQAELERICRFIGYSGEPVWTDEVGEMNVSSRRLRRSPLRESVRKLPGVWRVWRTLLPEPVRQRINALWTMRRRPELDQRNIERLTAIFDEDLAKLGKWLGLELNCSNFKAIAKTTAAQWSVSLAGKAMPIA